MGCFTKKITHTRKVPLLLKLYIYGKDLDPCTIKKKS